MESKKLERLWGKMTFWSGKRNLAIAPKRCNLGSTARQVPLVGPDKKGIRRRPIRAMGTLWSNWIGRSLPVDATKAQTTSH